MTKSSKSFKNKKHKKFSSSDDSDSGSEEGNPLNIAAEVQKAVANALEILPTSQLAEQGASLILGLIISSASWFV